MTTIREGYGNLTRQLPWQQYSPIRDRGAHGPVESGQSSEFGVEIQAVSRSQLDRTTGRTSVAAVNEASDVEQPLIIPTGRTLNKERRRSRSDLADVLCSATVALRESVKL